MKYLSFLNLSNADNISCDSGYIFQTQLGSALVDLGNVFTLVIPVESELKNELINLRVHNFGANKFQVRFSFDWNSITSIIKETNPDIIISNQPEISSNIKAVIISEQFNARLYTYVHYYPFSVASDGNIIFDSSLNNKSFCESIILSFISGLLASDKILIHSQYGNSLLNILFKHYNINIEEKELVILPPPLDSYIADGLLHCDSNRILYNHRLYKQYGAEFLINFANIIANKFDWKIVVADLLYNRNLDRKKLDLFVDEYRNELLSMPNVEVRIDGNDRKAYRNIICSSRIGLAPFRPNCTWSMSVIDCMSVGLPVVAPDFAWFSEFIPKELLFNSQNELIRVSKKLFIDRAFYSEMSEIVKSLVLSSDSLNSHKSAEKLNNL